MFHLRRFQPGDEPALFEVHRSAIEVTARRDYSAAQVRAWVGRRHDAVQWALRMQGIAPFVVLEGERPVGYADLQANGHIDHFYVSGHHAGRGIGGLLMRRLHEEAAASALAHMWAHVSLTAEPFFRHFGFDLIERCAPVRNGVVLPNALMRKPQSGG